MDHAVHYRTSDGETRFEDVASLDAAVAMVERLRNDEGVSDVRVYRQVPIEFKAYYKVVVGDGAPATPAAAPAPAATPAPPAAPATPPPGAMPLGPATPAAPPAVAREEEPDANRRGSLFSRG
jgi:hypothetical protein